MAIKRDIVIIIPCYKGGRLLSANLPKLFDYINNHKENRFKVIVINDGSTDNTLEILRNIKGIILLSYAKNKGKGGAVQYGIKHIKPCDAVIIMDADFSTDLKAIDDSINEIKNNDVVIASRFLKDSYLPVKRSLKRRIVSKCCNIIVNLMFHFHLKDTQCGFKCFKYNVAKLLTDKQTIQGWSFDVEYLYLAKLNGYKIKEIPVTWTESDDSTVKVTKASLNFFKSLFTIKKNH